MTKKINTKKDIQESKHFCILPWIHSHILPDSTVLPCCVSDFTIPYGKVDNKSMKEVWNEKPFNEMRTKMLEDKPVRSCHNCYELEAGKMQSMRQRMNRDFAHHVNLLENTLPDGQFPDIKMKYLDIRFSNLCNFKCRGCSPFCSSQWYDDYKELWGMHLNEEKIVSLHKTSSKQKEELDGYLESLEVAYFAGGEPLMMDEHYYCLEKLIELGKDIPIHYNSNLSVLKFKKYDLIELWKKFSRIDLNISLDDIESRGEYFRHGLNWEKFQKNLLIVKKEIPYARFQITCTITLFNIHRIPTIHQKFMELGLIDEYGFTLNPLQDPMYYRTQALPAHDKKQVTEALRAYAADLDKKYRNKKWDSFKASIEGILTVMNKSDMTKELSQFKSITQKLDKVRGESFAETFPELSHLIESSILVFVPLRNQEVRIQPLMRAIEKTILPHCDEVMFVDEASTDQSLHVLNLELPELQLDHKLVKLDADKGRGFSFDIAKKYAQENGHDYILTFEEGWEDCIHEYISIIKSKEYATYDMILGKRSADSANLGSLIDGFSNTLTSLITRSDVRETKGDAINMFKVASLPEDKAQLPPEKSSNYVYPILLNELFKGKQVLYTATDNGINFRSQVKLNTARLLFVLKNLTGYFLTKLSYKK